MPCIFTGRYGACLLLSLLFSLSTTARAEDVNDSQLKEVNITGISGAPADNARRMLGIVELLKKRNATEAQIRYRHHQASEEIRLAIQPFGFYLADVRAQLQQQDGGYTASYTVDPGAPVRISELDIRLGEQQSLQQLFPLKPGDILLHSRYESGKTAITRRLRELGYFEQRLSRHRVLVDREAKTARIELHYAIGQRHVFGETLIEGAHVDERLVRRYLRFQPGEQFDQAQLNRVQRELNETNFFSDVLITTELAQRNDLRVPIRIRLQPGAQRAYGIGVSIGTDSGFGVELGADQRWLNRRGHSAGFEAAISQNNQRFGASYRIPDLDQRASGWRLGLSREHEENDSNERTTNRAELERFGLLGNDWRWTTSLAVERERFVIGGEEDSTWLVVPELTLGHKQADVVSRPRRGHSYQLELRAAPGWLGSNVRFYQAVARGKWIHPVGERDRLLLGGVAGTTEVNNFDRLPASYRFFAGGDRSLRGFDYEALGPLDDNGDVIGGRHLVLGSIEYERAIMTNWGGALFVDAGNALNRFSDDLEASIGLGVRFFSPLGPIRLDLARTLTDGVSGDTSWRLHFTVGPDL
jgi:translocation and assembly module TamA